VTEALPIAYDGTRPPSAPEIAAHAARLGLEGARWRVVRTLAGRTGLLGTSPDGDWIMKVAAGEHHRAAFARSLAAARLLDGLVDAGHAPWLVRPDAASWRVASEGETQLLAMPRMTGEPVAPERSLSPAEADAMRREGVPTMVGLLADLDALTPHVPTAPLSSVHLATWALERARSRMLRIVARRDLGWDDASSLLSAFEGAVGTASFVRSFTHGELTPYHMLRAPDGRMVLLDLESVGLTDIRHVDLTVATMRTWVLHGAEVAARDLVAGRIATLDDEALASWDAETRWQWLYALIRTIDESAAWADRSRLTSFSRFVLAPSTSHDSRGS